MISKLADIAIAEVGTREIGGNNCGTKIREYQKSTTLRPAAWPWCAAFVDWCIQKWISDPKNAAWLNLKITSPEEWRPKTAAAFGLLEWARNHPKTTTILGEKDIPKRGDIIVFDFSHTAIIVGNGVSVGKVETVEGNTNGRGDRDSESGDGVWRKFRAAKLTRNYIRIHPVS